MTTAAWPPEWIRGALSICVLAVVARHGPAGTYGYAIAQELAEHGLGTIKGGTLYPLLNRLADDDCVTATWVPGESGPGRKAFAITSEGRDRLAAQRHDWQTFTRITSDLIDLGIEPSNQPSHEPSHEPSKESQP